MPSRWRAAAARALAQPLAIEWLPTHEITDAVGLARFDGFWAAPGTPYRSLDGALLAVHHARTRGRPFLGTCGGFQHLLLEYARNVLGWADAMHAESDPGRGRPVIAALECALVEAQDDVALAPGSLVAGAYGAGSARATYRCRYGLNPDLRAGLLGGALRVSAQDGAGDVRAVELTGHPFFVGTLWQPERAALEGERVALAEALVEATARARRERTGG